MQAGGPGVGMVYAWSSLVDERGRIIQHYGHAASHEGCVFPFFISYNFIGNGSAPLLRRDYVLAVGGYDESLRARGGECEDLMLYLALAERYEVALVPAFLIGYRVSSSNLSSNVDRMRRGHELVLEAVRSRHPNLPKRIYRWSRSFNYRYLARRSLHLQRLPSAIYFFGCALVVDPVCLFEPPCWRAFRRTWRRLTMGTHRRRAAGAAAVIDPPSRVEVASNGEIDAFSRRRWTFLKNLAKREALRQPTHQCNTPASSVQRVGSVQTGLVALERADPSR
jgi:hypothetical protein